MIICVACSFWETDRKFEMGLTACLIIFVILATNGGSGKIIFVNESATWDEARSNCTYTYNGRLASLTENKDGVDACVPRNVDVWTGEYSQISPWIVIMGCYTAVYDSFHTLDYPSVFLCFKRCRAIFAIKENVCICPDYKDVVFNYTQLEASVCNFRCDVMAFCGGKQGYNVYWKIEAHESSDDQLCGTATCNENIVVYHTARCSEVRPFICGDDSFLNPTSYHDNVNWTTATDLCIARNNTMLAFPISCTDEEYHDQQFWIGAFRSEIILLDEGLDCYYTENGVDYQGYVNITQEGYICTDWSRVAPSYHHLEKNYCRNPSGTTSPWCIVCSDDCGLRWCNVTKCDTPVRVLRARQSGNGTIESTSVGYSNISEAPYLCKTDRDIQEASNAVVCRSNIVMPDQNVVIGDLNVKQLSSALPLGIGVGVGLIIVIAVAAVIVLKKRSATKEHSQRSVTSDIQTKMDDQIKKLNHDDKIKTVNIEIQTSSTRRDESEDSNYCEIGEFSLYETNDGNAIGGRNNVAGNRNVIAESANDILEVKRRRYEMFSHDDSDEHIYTITDPCEEDGNRGIADQSVYTCSTRKQYFLLENASSPAKVRSRNQSEMRQLSAANSNAKMYIETSEGSKSQQSKPDVNREYASKYGHNYFVLESTGNPDLGEMPRERKLIRTSANMSVNHTYIEIIGNDEKQEVTSTESRGSGATRRITKDDSGDGHLFRTGDIHLPGSHCKNEQSDRVDGDDNIDVYTQAKMDEYDHLHTANRRHNLTSTAKRLGDKEEDVYTAISEDITIC